MKVKSENEVAQLCPTPRNHMDCSLPGSSVHGIFQARELEWVAIVFSVTILTNYIITFFNAKVPRDSWSIQDNLITERQSDSTSNRNKSLFEKINNSEYN